MKLLSIVLLTSLFSMPFASLADPSSAKAGSSACPFAVNTVKGPNLQDKALSDTSSSKSVASERATNVDLSALPAPRS